MTSDLHVVLGSGPAGSGVAHELRARGHQVRTVDRTAREQARSDHRVADLSDPDQAAAATDGAAVLYHCVNLPYHLQVEGMPPIGEAILAAARTHGARLVVLDTLYPYGRAEGEHLTEQTPWQATTAKGRMRAALDTRYLQAHRSGEARTVMGRSADFFGPGVVNSTLGGAAVPGVLTGTPSTVFGDVDLPHSYTYIRDVARGLVTLGEHPEGDGRVWHLPTNPALTTRQVMARIGEIAGRSVDLDVVTEAKAVGPFDETFMNAYAEMFYQHEIAQNVVSEAFEKAFDVHPTPWSEALTATVEWYRGQLG